jgi:hypothetical protein
MVRTETEPPDSELPEPRWLLRDWMAAGILFAATASVVLWQNTHVAALFDISYILNTATRIAFGQVPYRDFPLAHAPLTFLIQAAIIRLTGRVFFHHVVYVSVVGGLGTVLAWRITLASLRGRVRAAWTVALLLAAPLTVLGIYCILPNPEYDCDCGFWILAALWLLQRMDAKRSVALGFATGAALTVPLFFKQNMGLPFLAAALGSALLVLTLKCFRGAQNPVASVKARTLVSMLGGACAALMAAVLVLHGTAGLSNYVHWTIAYAGKRRWPEFGDMLDIYLAPTLLWMAPSVAVALELLRGAPARFRWARIAAFGFLAAPFLVTLTSLLIYDTPDDRAGSLLALWPLLLVLAEVLAIANLFRMRREASLRLLLPLILLAAIHGALMSQQLWGSTYAIWPLFVLLVAELLAFLERFMACAAPARWFVPALAALISVTLVVCGGFYAASEDRLSYANLPDEPPAHSAFPALAGLATPGPYLPEIDELLRYAQANIPFDDGVVLIPGEEPFYFATGRVQRFPVPFFDPTIDPYSPAEIASLVRSLNIRWLIVKTDLQTKEDSTPDRTATMRLLMTEFTIAAHLHGYDIYRR